MRAREVSRKSARLQDRGGRDGRWKEEKKILVVRGGTRMTQTLCFSRHPASGNQMFVPRLLGGSTTRFSRFSKYLSTRYTFERFQKEGTGLSEENRSR